jgi:hypothetical protein
MEECMKRNKISNKILKKMDSGLITVDQAIDRHCYMLGFKASSKGRPDQLAHKLQLIETIKKFTENGKILLIEGGCDCDGSQYENKTRLVNATFVEVNAFIEDAENWADGSIYFDFDFPSNDEDYIRSSRDLVLEAFENGHQHIIYT